MVAGLAIFLSCPQVWAECSWQGKWDTNRGILILEQQGMRVTGEYDGPTSMGLVPAMADRDMLIGRWDKKGKAVLVLSCPE